MTTYIDLTQEQADQVGTPFDCDRCGEYVARKDGWGSIAQVVPSSRMLRVCMLCMSCADLLAPVFQEFFNQRAKQERKE
uniref:Uncharacterized protein n=1 Tax=viral metagenome TaxID=1070528 RepID=A0A6M3LVF1_9ZZZZ